MKVIASLLLAPVTLLASNLSARAETSKAFTVGAVIAQGCAVTANSGAGGTYGNIDFGTLSGLAAQSVSASLVSSGQQGVKLDCTPGMSVNLTADQGDHASGGVRQLAHSSQASSTIPYQLFANGSQTAWTTQAVGVSFPAGVQQKTLTLSATASLSGPTRGGAYSDTVRITVAW